LFAFTILHLAIAIESLLSYFIHLTVYSYNTLKGPKHEKFVAGIFTQIRPVQIGELENRPKTLLSATALKILSAVGDSAKQFVTPSPTALTIFSDAGDSAKKYKMAIFKPKPSEF
jgi:hypothetical protein